MYKLIIFDLDGTLLDTSRTIRSVLNDSLKKFSLPPISLEKTIEFVGNGAKKLVERAVGGQRKELCESVYTDYSKNFANCNNSLTSLYSGASEALRRFGKAGVILAIVTNKPEQATLRVYEEFLSEYGFSAVVGQSEHAPLKPNPASTLKIIQDCGLKHEECLFVGDGETDVQTAANAGIKCVSALWGFRTREQLRTAGATLFAKNFNELEKIVME
ncbi:MAG: HAD family hydrolase [Clostridia bacterium]|nr:HAD family hydrolase [Clostridia bacterium]